MDGDHLTSLHRRGHRRPESFGRPGVREGGEPLGRDGVWRRRQLLDLRRPRRRRGDVWQRVRTDAQRKRTVWTESTFCSFTGQWAVDELCRVAHEVRIFPIPTYNTDPSPFVAPIADHARNAGWIVSIEKVPYEFRRGGNLMMKMLSSTAVSRGAR